MTARLDRLGRALRELGPSEQVLREARLELASEIENLLFEAEKLEGQQEILLGGWQPPVEEIPCPAKPRREKEFMLARVPKVYIDTVVFLMSS